MSNPEIILPRRSIPANAKRVFQGMIFEVWQWEQEMFDGSKEVFECIWRAPTVEVIATVGDKIIIEEQDQPDRHGFLSLVSGRADNGDDLLEEAKRECLEETGYASDDWSPLTKFSRRGKLIHEVSYFIARNCRKAQEPVLDAGERIAVRLVSFEEFLNLVEDPRFRITPEFIGYLARLQSDPEKKEEFRQKLFRS